MWRKRIRNCYTSVGSLTNTHNLANAAAALMKRGTSDNTVKTYIDYIEDAFLMHHAKRYDIKGKKYFGYPQKYYAMDLGLRNAKLNFRQQDAGHLMENVIFNELVRRGYSTDVGMVPINSITDGKKVTSQHEITSSSIPVSAKSISSRPGTSILMKSSDRKNCRSCTPETSSERLW